MKSREEVREALRILHRCQTSECGCSTPEHLEECRIGGMMNNAVIEALRWVIGAESSFSEMLRGMVEIQETGSTQVRNMGDGR